MLDFAKISLLTNVVHGCLRVRAVFSSSTVTCAPLHVVTPWMMATYFFSNVLSPRPPPRSAPLPPHSYPCHLSHQIHLTSKVLEEFLFILRPCHYYFPPRSPTRSLRPLRYPLPHICLPMIVRFPPQPLGGINKTILSHKDSHMPAKHTALASRCIPEFS